MSNIVNNRVDFAFELLCFNAGNRGGKINNCLISVAFNCLSLIMTHYRLIISTVPSPGRESAL